MPPLLKPVESILLILDPRPHHLERLDSSAREPTIRKLAMAHRAAQVANVPAYLASNGPLQPAETWIPLGPGLIAARNTHALPHATDKWDESPLGKALTATNRANLVLCGFWLECTVTFTALTTIVEGIDVSILMDATPSWLAETKQPAIDRLMQAGVVPMTTAQMVMEWAEVETSLTLKQELIALLPVS